MKQVITWLAAALCVVSLVFGASATERAQAGVVTETDSVQDESHESAQKLGTFSEWAEPMNLGAVVNSASNDWFPAISRNGLSLYISSNRPGGFDLQDIWVSQRVSRGDPWGTPVNLGPTINSGSTEWLPNFSPDGHWMFFISNRVGGCGGTDLWVSFRQNREDDFAWEAPMNLGCTINSDGFDGGPNYFQDRKTRLLTLYFMSDRLGGLGGFDIYASMLRRNGTFGAPALVWELSTPQNDLRTAIRRDGLEMLLYSDRPGGVGSFDLWVSTRETTQDAWSRPVNLGPTVNSDAEDRGPALSRDGTALYFNSNRLGFGGHDLYVTTRTRLVETSEVTQ
jgi:Tol biopolymer transport system component